MSKQYFEFMKSILTNNKIMSAFSRLLEIDFSQSSPAKSFRSCQDSTRLSCFKGSMCLRMSFFNASSACEYETKRRKAVVPGASARPTEPPLPVPAIMELRLRSCSFIRLYLASSHPRASRSLIFPMSVCSPLDSSRNLSKKSSW